MDCAHVALFSLLTTQRALYANIYQYYNDSTDTELRVLIKNGNICTYKESLGTG